MTENIDSLYIATTENIDKLNTNVKQAPPILQEEGMCSGYGAGMFSIKVCRSDETKHQ